MTPLPSDLPQDLGSYHALIAQLRIRLDVASQRVAELESIGLADAVSRIAQLEALVVEQEKTIFDFEQTIRKLSADNAMLKRSVCGGNVLRKIPSRVCCSMPKPWPAPIRLH